MGPEFVGLHVKVIVALSCLLSLADSFSWEGWSPQCHQAPDVKTPENIQNRKA